MSIDRLKSLYRYAGIEFDMSPAAIQTLKQIVLLRIKSSSSGSIEVDAITYTKGDVLKVLEADYSEHDFDPERFWDDFPELIGIMDGSVDKYYQGNKELFIQYRYSIEAQYYLSDRFSRTFEQSIRSRIIKAQFLPAAKRVSYLFVFNDETRIRIFQNLKNQIRQLLDAPNPGHSFDFLVWDPYYKIIQTIASDDQDFLLLQYNSGLEKFEHFAYDQASAYFRKQLTLNFDPFIRSQIEEHKNDFFNSNKREQREDGRSNSWRLVIYGVLIVAKIAFFASRCDSRNNSYQYNRPAGSQEHLKEILKLQEQYKRKFDPSAPITEPQDENVPVNDSAQFQP